MSELGPQKYRVVGDNLNYNGEIQVGVTFTQKVIEHLLVTVKGMKMR